MQAVVTHAGCLSRLAQSNLEHTRCHSIEFQARRFKMPPSTSNGMSRKLNLTSLGKLKFIPSSQFIFVLLLLHCFFAWTVWLGYWDSSGVTYRIRSGRLIRPLATNATAPSSIPHNTYSVQVRATLVSCERVNGRESAPDECRSRVWDATRADVAPCRADEGKQGK